MNRHAQVLVVSGFLGSGKTTLVRRLLEEGQRDGIRTAVVSNEFDALGIDEALMAETRAASIGEGAEDAVDFVELAGGCVCCRLSDDLLLTLQQLWERSNPERVIVETSGVALPYDTLINFWRDPVRQWAVDESSVVVVSAEQLATARDLDSTFEDQVCSADLLLLSKTDLISEEDSVRAEQTLRAMQPDVTILRAPFGDVDSRVLFPPDVGARAARQPSAGHDQHSHAHDDYRSEELEFASGVSETELVRVLTDRAALRSKGFVNTNRGVRLVQGVAGRIELTEPLSTPPVEMLGRVVVIERRCADDRATASSNAHVSHKDAGEHQ